MHIGTRVAPRDDGDYRVWARLGVTHACVDPTGNPHRRSPDEGAMDMARSLALYHELGYPCMIMPDHVPVIDGRDPSGIAFAFCYGYISGPMNALGVREHGCADP